LDSSWVTMSRSFDSILEKSNLYGLISGVENEVSSGYDEETCEYYYRLGDVLTLTEQVHQQRLCGLSIIDLIQ